MLVLKINKINVPLEVSCCCHCCDALPTTSLCSHPLFGLHKCSASTDECQRVSFFLHRRIQLHTFASSAFQYQMSFCQTAPLLPSVTRQQHGMEYWWEGSASAAITPTSDSVGSTIKWEVLFSEQPSYFSCDL